MILGVDYASIDKNETPNFELAYKSGIRFAIMRGTYGMWVDPVRVRDLQKSSKLMTTGSYLFPIYTDDPIAEANAFADAVGPLTHGSFPPILDIEFPGGILATNKTPKQAVDWLTQLGLQLHKRYGALMLYTSGRVWHEDLQDAISVFFSQCPLWLARYSFKTRDEAHFTDKVLPGVVPPQLGDSDDYWIHQFQGDAVHCPGFSSTVDLNLFRILRLGTRGSRVSWLMDRLGMPRSKIEKENVFDAQVEKVIKEYQESHNLTIDGIVGPVTFSHVCWENPS